MLGGQAAVEDLPHFVFTAALVTDIILIPPVPAPPAISIVGVPVVLGWLCRTAFPIRHEGKGRITAGLPGRGEHHVSPGPVGSLEGVPRQTGLSVFVLEEHRQFRRRRTGTR